MTQLGSPPASTDELEVDPVLSQVVHHYELTVNREMGRAVVNLSGSPLFVGASDFACACLDAEGNTLTNISWSLQMGYAITNTVRTTLKRYGDDIYPGDMIFCNDPYDGGGLHSADVVLIAPVFHDGELAMWVGTSAHVTDVGGAVPGSFSVEPMECYGENIRFAPIKFYDRGVYRRDVVEAFLANVRLQERTAIDLKAIMGANWIGRERIEDLLSHYGRDQLDVIHRMQVRQSDEQLRARLRLLPDGAYEGAAHMEHDGAEDKIYTVRVRIIKEGDEVVFDFSDTDPQAPGVLNSAEVGSTGNVVAALGTVIGPDIPFNEGMMYPLTIVSPPGTLVNAIKPAPIAGATIFGAWFGTDAILEAINYALANHPDTTQWRTGPWGCWTFGWLHCTNQYGDPWFFNVFTGGAGGAGAMSFRDGEPAMLGIQTIDAFSANIEDYEIQSPVLFFQRGLARDSGGPGKYRGGLALESFCVPWDTDVWNVTPFHNRLSAPASAVSGGYPGSGSSIRFARGSHVDAKQHLERHEEIPLADYIAGAERAPARGKGFTLTGDDGYYIRATGGPGYGDPLDREIALIEADVRDGHVSTESARDPYGAVIVDGRADTEASEVLCDEIRQARRALPLTSELLPEMFAGRLVGSAPVPTESVQTLSEYLEISDAATYRCRRCGFDYCGNNDNWKWFARFAQGPIGPEVVKADVAPRPSGDLVFRQYACPGCGTQVDTEVALIDELPRWNFRPLAVWRELAEPTVPGEAAS